MEKSNKYFQSEYDRANNTCEDLFYKLDIKKNKLSTLKAEVHLLQSELEKAKSDRDFFEEILNGKL